MSILLIRPGIDEWRPGEHAGTFRGNNHAFVTATTALALWSDAAFLENVAKLTSELNNYLNRISTIDGRTVRRTGRGLMQGLQFEDRSMSDRVMRRCWEQGIFSTLCGSRDDVLKVLPPLTSNVQQLESVLAQLEEIVKEVIRLAWK